MNDLFNGVVRGISTLIGVLMIAMGCIWILQGFNIAFLNSFMANDKQCGMGRNSGTGRFWPGVLEQLAGGLL